MKPHQMIACALLPLTLASQSRGDSTSVNDLLQLSLAELGSIKVTSSTMTEETLKTVPSSITVYTRDEIRALGITYLHQLVNLVPGYQSSRTDDSGAANAMSSRGRRLGSTSSREILMLIDGQRLNADWNGGGGLLYSLLPLDNVERVEFIRGPGSAIYGSNAMMGVINIITRSDNEVQAEGGSHRLRRGSAQWHTAGEAGKLDLYASSGQTDGEPMTLFSPPSTGSPAAETAGRDAWRSEDAYLHGELGEFSLAMRKTGRQTGHFYNNGWVLNSDVTRYDTNANYWNAGWKHEFSTALTVEAHLSHSNTDHFMHGLLNRSPALFGDSFLHEEESTLLLTAQGNAGSGHWLTGYEVRDPQINATRLDLFTPDYSHPISLRLAPDGSRNIHGLFAQYQWQVNDRTEMTFGLRHDDFSDFGSHNSPRVALVQQLDLRNTVKLLYSEAFRAPSLLESEIINNPEYLRNPDLQPEVAKTTELVWLHLVDRGYISTTLFDTHIKDAVTETITPGLQRTWVNDLDTVAGVEVEWQYHWNDRWQSRIAVTDLLDPIDQVSTEASRLFGGSLTYHRNRWTASLLANYQSAKTDPNEQDVPTNITTTETTRFGGHTVVGAHVAHQLMPELEIYLHADNLFDKTYSAPANRAVNYEGVPGNGRLLTAGVRWNF